jgi:hypothetical protein
LWAALVVMAVFVPKLPRLRAWRPPPATALALTLMSSLFFRELFAVYETDDRKHARAFP